MEYLVTEAFSKAKKEKRKTVYYKDLGTAMCVCVQVWMANAYSVDMYSQHSKGI